MDHNDHAMSPDELAAQELFQQLLALSPGIDETALRLTIRLGDGRYVGDLLLSANDVAALNDSLISLNAYRADTNPTQRPAQLPIDDQDITDMVNALEDLANGTL